MMLTITVRMLLAVLLSIAITSSFDLYGASKGSRQNQTKKRSSKAKKRLNWKKYHAVCGAKNDSRESNFDQVKGITIYWVGAIAEITKDPALSENRRWAENVIRVKMDPSDSLVADVRFRIPKDKKDKMESFEKGQYIAFMGKIMYLGTRLSDHVVEVQNFKRVKAKSTKKSSKKSTQKK